MVDRPTIGFAQAQAAMAAMIEKAKAAAERQARLAPLEPNPIDEVWTDQPLVPMGAVRVQPERFAGESAADRRRRIGSTQMGQSSDNSKP